MTDGTNDKKLDTLNLLKALPEGYLSFGADPASCLPDLNVWCAGWFFDGMGHWEFYGTDPYSAIEKAYIALYGEVKSQVSPPDVQ
jgi:hypothetical protein